MGQAHEEQEDCGDQRKGVPPFARFFHCGDGYEIERKPDGLV